MNDRERITRLEIRCEQLQLTVNEAFHWIDILKSDLSGLQDRAGQADRKTEPQTHEIRTNTHECVKDTHDKTELTEPHIYGLFRKGELSDDDVKELKKQIGQIIEYADRKTENSSEKPNNCEHITEDGVTCARYPACRDIIIAQAQLLKEYREGIETLEQLNKSQGDVIVKLERLITNIQEKGVVSDG